MDDNDKIFRRIQNGEIEAFSYLVYQAVKKNL